MMKNVNKIFVLFILILTSYPLAALEPHEVWNNCESMFGNNIAVKKYISSLKGQQLSVSGKVHSIKEGFLWSDPVISIDTGYRDGWLLIQYVDVSMPESFAVKMRVGESYNMTADIKDIKYSTDSDAFQLRNNCFWIETELK